MRALNRSKRFTSVLISTTIMFSCLLLGTTVYAQSKNWPDKSIKLIVGFPPGGANDIAARVIGKKLSENLGVKVVVDNKPGAGGNIAHAYTATAPADGSVIFIPPTVAT